MFCPIESGVLWALDERHLMAIGEETLEKRGIIDSDILVPDGDMAFVVLVVEARAVHDNLTLECLAVISRTTRYSGVLLRIQGVILSYM